MQPWKVKEVSLTSKEGDPVAWNGADFQKLPTLARFSKANRKLPRSGMEKPWTESQGPKQSWNNPLGKWGRGSDCVRREKNEPGRKERLCNGDNRKKIAGGK